MIEGNLPTVSGHVEFSHSLLDLLIQRLGLSWGSSTVDHPGSQIYLPQVRAKPVVLSGQGGRFSHAQILILENYRRSSSSMSLWRHCNPSLLVASCSLYHIYGLQCVSLKGYRGPGAGNRCRLGGCRVENEDPSGLWGCSLVELLNQSISGFV